eukprot:SRR837773.23265.p2 GENE.SRR837773.23265~~SRR837773.23265.p2  ORF type:complete len:186 (-),score=58.55 SRR837773.23265:111-668(-)
MGDFVRSAAFASTLRENISRYFGVPLEKQAVYDEDGLLTTGADFSRALQRVHPKLYVYDVTEMNRELRDRTVEELEQIDAEVELSWRHFGAQGTARGRLPGGPGGGASAAAGEAAEKAPPLEGERQAGGSAGGLQLQGCEGSYAEGGSGGTGWAQAASRGGSASEKPASPGEAQVASFSAPRTPR